MEAFVLGTSGSMPLPNRFLTSALLRREGDLFLFDCGEGAQVSLRKLNLKWKKINVILISHTHADHITGLPGILMLSSQVERDEPLYIIGPARVAEYVEMNRKVLEMHINYPIIVQEIKNPDIPQTVFETDEYLIRSFPLRHTRVCVGYSFEEKPRPGIFNPEKATELEVARGPLWAELQSGQKVQNIHGDWIEPNQVMGKKRRGRKFSYVTDSLPIGSISDEVAGSDLFFCEGMFEHALRETAHAKKHMTAQEAAGLAAKSTKVGRLGLFHFSPRYTDRELETLQEEAKLVFPETMILKDRQVLSIPQTDEEA